jgi:predicted nucleic-acid-binding protein
MRLDVQAHDDKQQMKQAKELFKRAQVGDVDLVTGPPVFFEIAWVLDRLYKRTNNEVLDFLEAIISFPNLKVLDKELVVAAISLAREANGTFADSYIAASIHRAEADNVATFNWKHFTKLNVGLYPSFEYEGLRKAPPEAQLPFS